MVDFGELKPILRDICRELDHRMLVPIDHPDVSIQGDDPVQVTVGEKTYQFPRSDVVLLGLAYTTVEYLVGFNSPLSAKGY